MLSPHHYRSRDKEKQRERLKIKLELLDLIFLIMDKVIKKDYGRP
jgi:hypothetical protein